jgi:hypothetical protein
MGQQREVTPLGQAVLHRISQAGRAVLAELLYRDPRGLREQFRNPVGLGRFHTRDLKQPPLDGGLRYAGFN